MDNYYNYDMVYNQAKAIKNLCESLLHSKKFKRYMDLYEIGSVKVNTTELLKRLNYFLGDENSGIIGILKEKTEERKYNLPLFTISKIDESVKDAYFFKIYNEEKFLILHAKKNNIKKIVKTFNKLYSVFLINVKTLYEPLFFKYDKNTQNVLKRYKLKAKASIIKILETFKTYFFQNYNNTFGQ
jgi:hypothetical protein